MASDENFVLFVVAQIKNAGEITTKKLFGEYGIYADNKIFGLICDNKLFVKPTPAGKQFAGNIPEAPAYPGGKPGLLIEEKLDDSEWLSKLVRITVAELPEPKLKKKKNK